MLHSLSHEQKEQLRRALDMTKEQRNASLLSTRKHIPVSIFLPELGIMEAIVKHLHENEKIPFYQIASIINRNPKSIWASYQAAKAKVDHPLPTNSDVQIPTLILREVGLGALEAIAYYVRQSTGKPFREIGELLNRHENTIRTAYQRAKHKKLIL